MIDVKTSVGYPHPDTMNDPAVVEVLDTILQAGGRIATKEEVETVMSVYPDLIRPRTVFVDFNKASPSDEQEAVVSFCKNWRVKPTFIRTKDSAKILLVDSCPQRDEVIRLLDQCIDEMKANPEEKPEDTSIPIRNLRGRVMANPPSDHSQSYLSRRKGRW